MLLKLFKKNKSPAVTNASSSTQTTPKDLFRSSGDNRLQNDDYNGAVMMYDEALRYSPTDTTLLLNRSFAQMMSTPPSLDLALQDADAAIQHCPTSWQGWSQKGETHRRMGDIKKAEEALVNAVECAQGMDKLTARRSLADVQTQRGRTSATASPSSTSVQYTPPTPFPEHSLHTTALPSTPATALSHTPPVTQKPPTTNPTNTILGPTETAPLNNQPMAPTAPLSHSPSVTASSATRTTRTTSDFVPRASNTQTSAPTPPLSHSHSHSPPVTASSTTRTTRTTSDFVPRASNTQTSAPTTPLSHSPPVTTSSTTRTPRTISGSVPGASNTQTSVSHAPVPSLPLVPEDLPPDYTPSLTNPNPTVRVLSQQALETQLTQLQTTLAVKNKGSISIRPYTAARSTDAVQTIYIGMTQLELTNRELGTPTYLHSSFRTMAVVALDFPGNTFLDMDCESSGYYEGKLSGTVSICGYSGEYRAQQLSATPLLNLILESTNTLPTMALDKIVDRIQLLRRRPTLESNEGLREILGLSQLTTLQSGFLSGAGSRQRQIEAICMALNRSLYDAPSRFIDFSIARNISNNTLGSSIGNGIGLKNFLFQILLGAELLIRLRKEPESTSYVGLITDAISALLVLSDLWMQNVTIQGPSAPATTTPLTSSTLASNLPIPKYTLVAGQHQLQAEGLIRFGETISWPYMDEARNYIENAYQNLIANTQTVDLDTCDWLYGLTLPGKIFRHRIMCCLVYASPSVRSLNSAPFWDNGLVVKNKSYWPRRSVLGRVLGGLKNPRSVCGWIGPAPAPEGGVSGWIRLNARRVDIPVPVSTTQTSLQHLGFGPLNGTESPEAIIQSITDPNEWIQACPPSRPTNDSSRSVFKSIHLTEIASTTTTTVANTTSGTSKEYRASLNFEVNGSLTCYTLYSNPIFIYAPPCVGTHSMHRRQAQNYLSNVVRVSDLKEAYAPSDALVIIDAMGQGEEVVARAWCAERARHAVIRRDRECCFTCATAVAAGYTGLGVNVLIWSA